MSTPPDQTAKVLPVWEKSAPSYDCQIALRRQLPLVRAAGFELVEVERLKASTIERVHACKRATT